MGNPFDLRGPQFLLFYFVFGVAVNLVLRILILRSEKQDPPARWDYTDPYKIAYLRGGISEALRVAIFSLIDRGLLMADGDLIVAKPRASAFAQRPIEKAVLDFFDGPGRARDVFADLSSQFAGENYRQVLIAEGLVAGPETYGRRLPPALIALGLIIGVAAIKIVVALMRGRHNLGLLFILAAVFAFWAFATWRRQRTGAGDEIIHQMTLRFRSLKLRAGSLRPGGMTNEAAFLAAVFGLAALSEDYFPFVKALFPKTSSRNADTGGCGSSGCGSSGCGGGGCGGGGCGGCGS
ncbi:MAG: TIGR04222 domain-containing membrane protein [Nitrospirae bacterium]|nr:MAG: TIGR04222 domain-containing membrane protein [Nitrospirota bacterium]